MSLYKGEMSGEMKYDNHTVLIYMNAWFNAR